MLGMSSRIGELTHQLTKTHEMLRSMYPEGEIPSAKKQKQDDPKIRRRSTTNLLKATSKTNKVTAVWEINRIRFLRKYFASKCHYLSECSTIHWFSIICFKILLGVEQESEVRWREQGGQKAEGPARARLLIFHISDLTF